MADRCSGRSKRTKKPCKNHPMRGSKVCRMHGGGTPQARAKAAARRVEAEARRAFGRLADFSTPIGDPLTELSRLAGDVVAWKNFLAGRIENLETLRFEDLKGSEQIRGEIQLFRQALLDCNTILSTMGRLNIDQRLAAVTEQQADLLNTALTAALADMGLTHDQQREARSRVAAHLRVATG